MSSMSNCVSASMNCLSPNSAVMLSQSSAAVWAAAAATALFSVCVSVLLNCSMSPRRGARRMAAEEAMLPEGNSLAVGSGSHLGLKKITVLIGT